MKKYFCVLLAAVLVCLSVVPCAASDNAGFTDQSSIRNYNAVRMLYDLGLISGYSDGSFGPEKAVSREEVAKLMALLSTAEPEQETTQTYVPFYDAQTSWAAPYIAYCAEQNVIAGDNGRFRPSDSVTLRELAKMLLVILGEDPARYVGASWAANVDEDAFTRGIYTGLTAGYGTAASRDDACLLIYNAMLCPKVADAAAEGDQRYVLDALMNPMSYLEIRFGLTRYTATLTGNECADLTTGSKLAAGVTKLAGHKEFSISTDLSLLGRSVDIYVKDGKVFGVPCYAVVETYYTFSEAAALKDICAGGGFRLDDATAYYYNYAPASKDILNSAASNDKITVIDHDGDHVFDVVLVTTSRPAIVTALSPLTVDVDGQSFEAQGFARTDTFAVGDEVYFSQILGTGYIRRLN